jgi:hypothetical protein
MFEGDNIGDIRRYRYIYIYIYIYIHVYICIYLYIYRELMKYNDTEIFELRSAYPPRILPDSMSLKEAGLIPNGTIHARKI